MNRSNLNSRSEIPHGTTKILPRSDFIRELVRQAKPQGGPVLNLGCKATRFGDVNVDIRWNPEVRANALALPFKNGSFSVVVFSEVLEHLPRGTELRAFREIHRVLKPGGILVLSTPSAEGLWGKLYTITDPAFWTIGHRHYTEDALRRLLDCSGFTIDWLTKRGGPRDVLFGLATPFAFLVTKLTYPLYPNIASDYSFENTRTGYTIIIRAKKSSLGSRPRRISEGRAPDASVK